jgi:glycosyltransferase involved in cell wall biosynthesis
MKIEVVSFTGDSGLADYTVSLARALARTVTCRVVTAQSLSNHFDNMGFTIDRVFRRSRHYPIDIFRFLIGVITRRPDWVLIQGPLKFAFLDSLIARTFRLFNIKVAVTVHDVLPHYPRAWSRMTYGFYYRSFNRVIVHSGAARAGVQKLGVQVEILVVPHGIYDIFDLTSISSTNARKRIGGLNETDFILLFFGHLEPRKGLMEFISAAEALSNHEHIKFLIAGGSDLSKHGQAYVERFEAAKQMPNVIIHDRRIPFEEVENYFAASDAIALPYLEGTTSGVLKLALAFGKPVIATRVGDFPEQIPDGAGVIIENDDNIITALCAATEKIESQQAIFSNTMANARHLAQWPDIANQIISYLESK